jgi:hypothetical protein
MNATDPWAFGWTQVLTIVGFGITICIAIGGFRTFGRWKREKIEERRIEVAIDMLSVVYEAKFVFDNIRGPMTFEYEWEDMPSEIGNDEADRRRRGQFYATLKRIRAHREFFEKSWNLQARCTAVFGTEAEEIFLLMHQARREIEVAAEMLLQMDRREADRETIRQFERDVWNMGSFRTEQDQVGAKLVSFRSKAEALCRPVIDQEFGRAGRRWSREKTGRAGHALNKKVGVRRGKRESSAPPP